jgi:hypothetical protein
MLELRTRAHSPPDSEAGPADAGVVAGGGLSLLDHCKGLKEATPLAVTPIGTSAAGIGRTAVTAFPTEHSITSPLPTTGLALGLSVLQVGIVNVKWLLEVHPLLGRGLESQGGDPVGGVVTGQSDLAAEGLFGGDDQVSLEVQNEPRIGLPCDPQCDLHGMNWGIGHCGHDKLQLSLVGLSVVGAGQFHPFWEDCEGCGRLRVGSAKGYQKGDDECENPGLAYHVWLRQGVTENVPWQGVAV